MLSVCPSTCIYLKANPVPGSVQPADYYRPSTEPLETNTTIRRCNTGFSKRFTETFGLTMLTQAVYIWPDGTNFERGLQKKEEIAGNWTEYGDNEGGVSLGDHACYFLIKMY